MMLTASRSFFSLLFCAFGLSAFAQQSPVIQTQPVNRSAPSGGTATFSVSATGSAPLIYQWQLFGTNLPGATQPALTISNITPANGGPYAVTVSNSFGGAVSSTVFLNIDESLTFRVVDFQTNGVIAVEHSGTTGSD